jgi:antitoxin HicB
MTWASPLSYRIELEPDDNDTVLVSFPDFPEAHTFGDTEDEAIAHASDALETVIDAYIKARRSLPAPSAGGGRRIEVPTLTLAKMALHQAMLSTGMTKAGLAARLQIHPPQVDRLLDIRHASRLELLEAALKATDTVMRITFSVPVPDSVRPHVGRPVKATLERRVPHRPVAAARKVATKRRAARPR